MIELTAIIAQLQQPYIVTRESEVFHIVNDELSMTIKTFVRIMPDGSTENQGYTIHFTDKAANHQPIKSGTVFEMLKERYFKPEMVIY